MKKIIFMFLSFLLAVANLTGQQSNELNGDSTVNKIVKTYLLGNISFGIGAKDISFQKVDAALNLAFILSERHYLVPSQLRDSIADYLRSNNQNNTVAVIADTLKVDYIVFAHVNRIQNMLRIDITLINSKDAQDKSEGEGYSLIHYMEGENKPLYDPSLLSASQRALAVALKDSGLYSKTEQGFNVKPAPTLVVGGIEFINNPQFMPKWSLFERSILTSYDAVESIFEEARFSEDFVIYDIPTRDTIYALFNMLIVENHRPASYHEIEALEKFGVKFYISGKFSRQKEFSNIELSLCEIKNTGLVVLKTYSEILTEDNLEQFRAILKEITGKLLKQRTDEQQK